MAGRVPIRQRQCEPPNQPADTTVAVSPIGAVIYDAKLESPLQDAGPASTRPRPSPRTGCCRIMRSARGRAISANRPSATLLFPPMDKEGKCQPTEIGFLGYSDGYTNGATGLPTRLSLFHWVGKDVGLPGIASSSATRASTTTSRTEPNQFVTQVTTYNLMNDRSLLCQVDRVRRAPTPGGHSSWSREAPRWISATAHLRPNLP